MFGLGMTELIIIGLIIFILFGAKRIPEIGKGLGGALKEFRNIKKDLSPSDTIENGERDKKDESDGQKEASNLENKITEKVLNEIPSVKKVVDVTKKIKKVKEILK